MSRDGLSAQLVGADSTVPQRAYPTGMWVALGGILMFFIALISAWVVRRGLSTSPLEGPLDIPGRLLAANTAVLIVSSITLETARRKIRSDTAQAFRTWWYATTVLGLMFLVGQLVAWQAMAARGLYLASNPDASFFYLFTAAHGIHLLGGIAGLLIVALKPLRQLTLATATRVAAMYWHFLTVIWVAIFVLFIFASRS